MIEIIIIRHVNKQYSHYYLVGGLVVRVWNKEIWSFYDHKFESCDY